MHLKTAEAEKYFLVFSARKDGVRAIGPAEEVDTDGGIPGATFEYGSATTAPRGTPRLAPQKAPGGSPGTPAPNHRPALNSCRPPRLLCRSSPPPASRFTTHVPVYDLTAAAGLLGPGERA
jgi:hypothetical protein